MTFLFWTFLDLECKLLFTNLVNLFKCGTFKPAILQTLHCVLNPNVPFKKKKRKKKATTLKSVSIVLFLDYKLESSRGSPAFLGQNVAPR